MKTKRVFFVFALLLLISCQNNAVKDANKSKDPVLYIKGIYPSGKKEYFTVPLGE